MFDYFTQSMTHTRQSLSLGVVSLNMATMTAVIIRSTSSPSVSTEEQEEHKEAREASIIS